MFFECAGFGAQSTWFPVLVVKLSSRDDLINWVSVSVRPFVNILWLVRLSYQNQIWKDASNKIRQDASWQERFVSCAFHLDPPPRKRVKEIVVLNSAVSSEIASSETLPTYLNENHRGTGYRPRCLNVLPKTRAHGNETWCNLSGNLIIFNEKNYSY